MKEKVRIGIIGVGRVAQARHLPALAKVPEAECVLAWSRSPIRAREAAQTFGIDAVVDDWREIVEAPDLDAVIVATPPVLHREATVAALQAGKHVLCQARMARNLSEARDMLAAARRSDLVTALYPPPQGLKGDRTMRRLLHDENFVGDIREVRVTGMYSTPERDDYSWQADPAVTGINAMTLGMWIEVLNRWVGPASFVSARGTAHRSRRRTASGEMVAAVVPDSLAIVADLECGATASYHFSAAVSSAAGSAIEIYGSHGALAYRLSEDEILGASRDSDTMRPIAIPTHERRTQDTDARFVRAILEGTPVTPDFEEGVRYMEFCEAVAFSLKTGSSVSVPPSSPKMDSWDTLLDEVRP